MTKSSSAAEMPSGRNRLTAEVYERILTAIVERRLEPGQPVLETILARDLGVSRTPVREALQILLSEGLVVQAPSGVAVAELTVKDVQDLLQTSRALQTLACQLVVRRADDEQVARLRQTVRDMEDAAEAGDLTRWIAGDTRLHRQILSLADNRPLLRMSGQLDNQIARVRHLAVRQPGRLAQSNREHRAVVEAIAARDAELAQQAMENHLKTSEDTLIGILENFVVPFKGDRF